jgi:serine/threonine-protein kinase
MSDPLDPEAKRRWRERLRQVDALLDLDDAERDARIAAIDDPTEREAVIRLIARSGRPSPLDVPAAALLAAASETPEDWEQRQIGRRIGPFTLERPLGRGGMGTVFLATRTLGEALQRVALKLLPAADPGLRRRFAREQRALAALSHPHICRLVDAGEAEDGTPWLAMEFVDGESLAHWCERHALDARGRVALLRPVADALAAAHRGLFVHRDIKPSNLLVDAAGAVHLLDFGITKLLGGERDLTEQRHGPMTPDYAAPEQFRGGAVTVATDVYQFGVLLFALIAGRLPYATSRDDPLAFATAVCEEPPLGLSQVPLRAELALGRGLRRDLDAVIARCLAKAPEARYRSMDALLADLDALVEGRPVSAIRQRGYRLRHFLRRHWLATLASTAAVLALALLTAWSLREAERARRAAEAASVAAERTNGTVKFLAALFVVPDPGDGRARRLRADELLRSGAAGLPETPGGDPLMPIVTHAVLGYIHTRLEDSAAAVAEFRVALAGFDRVDPRQAMGFGEIYAMAAGQAALTGDPALARSWLARSEQIRGLAPPNATAIAFEQHLARAVLSRLERQPAAVAGELAAARVLLEAGLDDASAEDRVDSWRALAAAELAAGDLAHAESSIASGRNAARALPAGRPIALALDWLAVKRWVAAGRPDAAKAEIDRIEPAFVAAFGEDGSAVARLREWRRDL